MKSLTRRSVIAGSAAAVAVTPIASAKNRQDRNMELRGFRAR
jgi:hypothetical protein